MPRVLAVIRDDAQGQRMASLLRSGHRDVLFDVVHDWRGMVSGFGETYPRALLIDLRFAEDGGPEQVRSVQKSAPWLPVIAVGDPSGVSGECTIEFGQAGITAFVAPEEFDESDALRAAISGEGRLVGQVLEALRVHREPRPLPAELVAVLEVALERRPCGLSVKQLATTLGQSESALRRLLQRSGGPPPGLILRWSRVLWAVQDLTAEPPGTAESVAYDLGFSGISALGNVLADRLGTRVRGTRTMGMERAVAGFVAEFTPHPEPGGAAPRGR